MIKIGDRVKFLSDTGSGVVTQIKGAIATVSMEDGFDVPAPLTELVAVAREEEQEAISKIGVGDPRPGVVRRRNDGEPKKSVKRAPSYARYGKISLTSDYDDDEEIIDVTELRQRYLKNFAAINAEAAANAEAGDKADDGKDDVLEPARDASCRDVAAKPRTVALEELPGVLGMETEEKKSAAAPKTSSVKRVRACDEEVIDLHAGEVLPSVEGLMPGEILAAQMSRFEIALSLAVESKRHGRIIFIHGVGAGKLKYEIERRLRRDYPKLAWQDASFAEYGYGAIMVFY